MIGIISDIHGNYEALQAVLEELERQNVTAIFCLGDVAGYYCQINECCEALRTRSIPTLLGNHDWYLASGEGCPRSNSANTCLDYQRQVITLDNLNWLKSLPENLVAYSINMVHGGWQNFLDEYITPSASYFAAREEPFFVSGHIHVPFVRSYPGKHYCNPGSVGQPRDGDPRASFALFNGEFFILHRVKYNIEQLQKTMIRAGFDEYFYKDLANGARIGGHIDLPPKEKS